MKLIHDHNCNLSLYVEAESVDLIYADMIYDSTDFSWLLPCYEALKPTGSLFVQTDFHTVTDLKLYADQVFKYKSNGYMNNWIIWPYDWGGRAKDAFGRKHDDILWYVKTSGFQFYPERIAIPKKTAGSKEFNPSGRETKTPTDVWSDIGNFLTTSPERVKGSNGHCVPWQKPERLIRRIVLSTTNRGDLVVDPFLGTGTTAVVCKKLFRKFVGLDYDDQMVKISYDRIKNLKV